MKKNKNKFHISFNPEIPMHKFAIDKLNSCRERDKAPFLAKSIYYYVNSLNKDVLLNEDTLQNTMPDIESFIASESQTVEDPKINTLFENNNFDSTSEVDPQEQDFSALLMAIDGFDNMAKEDDD